MKFFSPPPNYRTYRLHLYSLLIGGIIACFGIYRNADLIGVAAVLAAVLGPVTGFSAWNNIGTNPAPSKPENPQT